MRADPELVRDKIIEEPIVHPAVLVLAELPVATAVIGIFPADNARALDATQDQVPPQRDEQTLCEVPRQRVADEVDMPELVKDAAQLGRVEVPQVATVRHKVRLDRLSDFSCVQGP